MHQSGRVGSAVIVGAGEVMHQSGKIPLVNVGASNAPLRAGIKAVGVSGAPLGNGESLSKVVVSDAPLSGTRRVGCEFRPK
jgi:hypothetical protein